MSEPGKGDRGDPLFRREAVEEYLRGRDHGRLLKLSPLWSTWAFGLLVLVFAGAVAFAALVRVGTDVRGQAIARHAPAGPGALEVVCVLPAGALASLRGGERVVVQFGDSRGAGAARLPLRLAGAPSEVLAPDRARAALGPDAGRVAVLAGPVVLVRAALPDGARAGGTAIVAGDSGIAWVRTGETSLLRALAFGQAER